MKKGKTIEIPLPEAMIQHIQSFMSRKEAARSSLLSKSWYNAWLTRPTLDFHDRDFLFHRLPTLWPKFEEFAWNTMKRYRDSRLKIECFRLHLLSDCQKLLFFAHKLVVGAVEIGATDVELEFVPFGECGSFTVPRELLASKTLTKLSLTHCRVDGNNYVVSFSNLKSLSLNDVVFKNNDVVFDDILSRNAASFEELSLRAPFGSAGVSRMHSYEFHKLRRLSLYMVDVGNIFSSGFASRFPCLEDLSINRCVNCTEIQIGSISLRTISFKLPVSGSWRRASFDVPNIQKFIYSGSRSPAHLLSIKASASREWEFDVSIRCMQLYKSSWFLNLKKYLSKFRLSKMSLSIFLTCCSKKRDSEHEVDDIDIVAQPTVVENLMVEASPFYSRALVFRLFGICRPKFLTLYQPIYSWYRSGDALEGLCKRLMQQQSDTPNWRIPDQSTFGQFGLKKVKVEVNIVLKKPLQGRHPEEDLQKIRFQLMWED